MRCEIEKLNGGWFQLYLRFRPNEIDALANALRRLRQDTHVHLANSHQDKDGVADIEISLQGSDEPDNMKALF
jgi:hypothetical protein